MESRKKDIAVLFYDGPCKLCNFAVRICKRYDKSSSLLYYPLGAAESKKIPDIEKHLEKIDSVILWYQGKVYVYSDVLIRLSYILSGAARLMRILIILPRPLRDSLYRFIARNRYHWFGRQEYCTLEINDNTENTRFHFRDDITDKYLS
jgi:predicted DCC family thiol-disulfide oxidoreductase YuxK